MRSEIHGKSGKLGKLGSRAKGTLLAPCYPGYPLRRLVTPAVRTYAHVCATLVAFGCAAEAHPGSAGENKAIIGEHEIREYYQASPFVRQLMRESTGVWIGNRNVPAVVQGDYPHTQQTKTKREIESDRGLCQVAGPGAISSQDSTVTRELREYGICKRAAFAEQPAPGFCSGYFVYVSPTVALVQTSGHCIKTQAACENATFVTGYYHDRLFIARRGAGAAPKLRVERDLFPCKRILAHSFSRDDDLGTVRDYAIVEVTLPPDPRELRAFALAPFGATIHERRTFKEQETLYSVGHPWGTPAKGFVGDRVFHQLSKPDIFEHSVDTFRGQSGSVVAAQGTRGEAVAWGTHSYAPAFAFVLSEQESRAGGSTETVACLDYRTFAADAKETYGGAQYAYTGPVDLCARGLGPADFCDPIVREARALCPEVVQRLRSRSPGFGPRDLPGCRDLRRAFGDAALGAEYTEGPDCRRGLNYCQNGKLMDCSGRTSGPGEPNECESLGGTCTYLDTDYGCRMKPVVQPAVAACS